MIKIGVMMLWATCLTLNLNAQSIDSNEVVQLKKRLSLQQKDSSAVLILDSLANAYVFISPDTAMMYSLHGLELSHNLQYKYGESLLLGRIGVILWINGDHPNAIKYKLNSLKLAEKIGARELICIANIGLASIFRDQKDYTNALHYARTAVQLNNQSNFMGIEAVPNAISGSIFEKNGQLDSALYHLSLSYHKTIESKNSGIFFGWVNLELGNTQAKLGNYPLALEYFRISKDHSKRKDLAEAYLGMANIFYRQNEMDSARIYANNSMELAKRVGFYEWEIQAATLLEKIHRPKNTEMAYQYASIASIAKDSLYNLSKIREAQNLQFNELLRQQEISLKQKELEKERKQNIQLLALAAFVITFIFIVLILIKKRIQHKWISWMGIIALLLVFEFISMITHPALEKLTNHTPSLMLLCLVLIAAFLIPLHHGIEKWMKERLGSKEITNVSIENKASAEG